MTSLIRPALLAGAAALLALGAWQLLGSDPADAGEPSRNLVLGAGGDGDEPQTMDEFLTAVTEDVDRYWMDVFADSDLPEPRVRYSWIPAGQSVASACDSGTTMGDSAAAYCPGDDTIYISQKFASDIYSGELDHALPGSSQGYGGTVGDFAVAYIVAHEYGHQIQDELGLFQRGYPTVNLELQADCYAGAWANHAETVPDDSGRPLIEEITQDDINRALDAAARIGDDFIQRELGSGRVEQDKFSHGSSEQRQRWFLTGYQSGDPAQCDTFATNDL
jgi:hypothetical protein